MTEETSLLPKYTRFVVFPCDLERLKTDTEYKNQVIKDIDRGAIYVGIPPDETYNSFEIYWHRRLFGPNIPHLTVFLNDGGTISIIAPRAGLYSPVKDIPCRSRCVIL